MLTYRRPRFAYVTLVLVSATQLYLTLFLFIIAYDIWCQFVKRLGIRLREHFSDDVVASLVSIDSAKLPEIRGGVGKLHVNMHNIQCRRRYTLNFLPSTCMDDGETCERLWTFINALALRAKEMTAGHRHDFLNDIISAHNVRQMHHMSERFMTKHCESTKYVCSNFPRHQARAGRPPACRAASVHGGARALYQPALRERPTPTVEADGDGMAAEGESHRGPPRPILPI